MVTGGNVRSSEKFLEYFDVEPHIAPLKSAITAHDQTPEKLVDENTFASWPSRGKPSRKEDYDIRITIGWTSMRSHRHQCPDAHRRRVRRFP
jgi:hypothetical protein